jgi:hypothetical protein
VSSVAGGLVLDPGSRASTPPTRTKHTYPPAFELWWKEYPRHEDKIAALRAWKRVVAGGVSEDQLREAAVRYRNDPKRDPNFTKFGERWLNAGAYLDDGVVLRPEAHEIGASDARYQPFDLEEHLSSLAEIPSEPEERGDALATALPDVTNVGVGDQGSDAGDGLAEDARAQTSPPTPTTSEPEHLDESEIPGEVRALVDGIGS